MCADTSLGHQSQDERFPEPVLHYFLDPVRKLKTCPSRIEFLASSESQAVETDIWSLIENAASEVLSLDVFDTYLLRNNKPEARRYLELSQLVLHRLKDDNPQNIKLNSLIAEDLCVARAIGMKTTYGTRPFVDGTGEGLLDEVIKVQCNLLDLPEGVEAVFLEAEIEYEADNLVLNPLLLNIANRFKEAGGKLILISDMYLRADTIDKIIGRLTGQSPHDHLFSSADLIISKRSGKIFPEIEKELNIKSNRYFHVGDSWIGDVLRPREAGWRGMYFPVSELERLERRQGLADFISEMDAKGIETRSWAKE